MNFSELLDKHAVGAVGVEDAVQVVGFVLEDNGGEAPDSICHRHERRRVAICNDYLRIPLYHSVISRDRETSLASGSRFP